MLSLTANNTGNKRVAVDSNILVALVNPRNTWHNQARAVFSALEAAEFLPVYFDCVMNEAISVLGRRAEEQGRSDQLASMLDDLLNQVPEDVITWILTETRRLFGAIVQLVRQTNGTLNFHDALISLCCQELEIEFIFSFDADFDQISWLKRIGDESGVPS